MQTKLTLRLEGELIEAAKRYADARGTSLSKLVAGYLDALTRPADSSPEDDWKTTLSPITRNLVGLGRTDAGRLEVDESDYHRYLEEKHSRHLRDEKT
jgi:hypothetical protein